MGYCNICEKYIGNSVVAIHQKSDKICKKIQKLTNDLSLKSQESKVHIEKIKNLRNCINKLKSRLELERKSHK